MASRRENGAPDVRVLKVNYIYKYLVRVYLPFNYGQFLKLPSESNKTD